MSSPGNQSAQVLRQRLEKGAAALGIAISAAQQNRLLAYLNQLIRWNKTFNLTAVREPVEMVDRHLLDSLAVIPLISRLFDTAPIHLMDVGTGAGLPGIPLALVRPSVSLTLIESNGKKAAFLRQCQIELGMQAVQVCQDRVEAIEPHALRLGQPDLIISRAFRAISDYLELVAPFVSDATTVFAMKGPALKTELEQLQSRVDNKEVSKHLLAFLASHEMSTEILAPENVDVSRQIAVFRAPSRSGMRPSVVSLQE